MRLFVAVNPPRQFRDELTTRLDATRRAVPVAWTRPASWHLTLMFLGEWPLERAEAVGEALQVVAAGQPMFDLQPGRVGAFPSLARPRVLFLHMDGGDPLRQLADSVREAVDRTWPDGPQDRKEFRPHLTLARIKRPLLGAESTRLRALDLGAWDALSIDRLQLMASELRRDGARYTVVADLPLGG